MGHQLILIKNGNKSNITQMIGNLAWSGNVDTLGEELSFDYAYNDVVHISKYDIVELGDTVILFNEGKAIHRYIIIHEVINGRVSKSFTCFDYAYYLNKNKTVIQFKVSASDAIRKLCDKFSIKHNIANMPTMIKQIYKVEVSSIINDIMDQVKKETGSKYRMEMVDDVLTIRKQTDLLINPTVRLSSVTPLFPVTAAISNPIRSISMEDMKNKVIVATSDDTSTKIYAESSDTNSIKKYGLLTEVITVDAKNESQARNLAKNTLTDLNKFLEDNSLDLIGHDDIKSGRLIDINEPISGIVGRYLIKSASHSESNGIHRVSVQLEVS